MSRTISLTARTANNAQQTGQVWVFLFTVTHEEMAEPRRFASDPGTRQSTDPLVYGHMSRGDLYQFLPVGVVLPDDSEDAPPAMQLQLDNIERELIPLLRSVSTPALIKVEMVLASTPDIVEVAYPEFELAVATYDELTVSLDLGMPSLATEPYPSGTFTPGQFPAIFNG